MASLLYRIGRWSADHRWATIVSWIVLLALVTTNTATLSRPLSDEFTIEGSRFQQVLDQLQAEIPESAGGIGTVTFSTEDGFTDEQRAGVAELVEGWTATDGVIEATDPFATQEQLDILADRSRSRANPAACSRTGQSQPEPQRHERYRREVPEQHDRRDLVRLLVELLRDEIAQHRRRQRGEQVHLRALLGVECEPAVEQPRDRESR